MGFSLFQSTISYSFRTFLRRFLCSRLLRYQETNWVWTQPPQSSEGYMKNNNTTPCKYSMVFFGSPSWTRTNDPAVNSRMLYRLSYWGIYERKVDCSTFLSSWRHFSIFPGRLQPSIFDVDELNYCVRYGNRWILIAINTVYFFWRFSTLKTE